MDGAEASRYWCYHCSRVVNPIMEIEPLKCPICQSGFVEEMESAAAPETNENPFDFGGPDSERALSLWAPILLGMMSNPRRSRRSSSSRFRRMEFEEEDDEDNNNEHNHEEGDQTELDRELESIIRRRRRSSATILQLLQGIRAGMLSETENSEGGGGGGDDRERERDRDRDRENRDRERVILVNPFNQTIIVQGSYDSNNTNSGNHHIGSLGDYFIGPGLDMLLQHLAENDPNKYGTPPAQKEAIEAMPMVKVEDSLQCSVCLEDFEIGCEAKEMPCKHKFHSGCILPWLELHSSCPVCRYQLPFDDSKLESNGPRDNAEINMDGNRGDGGDPNGNENGRQFSVPLPWPFSSLFSPSTPTSTSGTQSNAGGHSSSSPTTNTSPGAHSHTHED